MLTCDQLQSQVSASELHPGFINPSRCITKEDETYLRDYTLAASVISWDEGTFGTYLQVTAGDIANIAFADDTVWYQINLHRAIPLDIETFHAHRLRIKAHYSELDAAEEECHQQPDGFAGDEVPCQLQPTQSAQAEFELGRHHGQDDAKAKLYPIYTQASCQYSCGYIEGYNSTSASQQSEAVKQAEWSVTYDPKWKWYQAWVGDRCIGKDSSYEKAERLAQRYIATDLMLKRQNAAVMAAVAG